MGKDFWSLLGQEEKPVFQTVPESVSVVVMVPVDIEDEKHSANE